MMLGAINHGYGLGAINHGYGLGAINHGYGLGAISHPQGLYGALGQPQPWQTLGLLGLGGGVLVGLFLLMKDKKSRRAMAGLFGLGRTKRNRKRRRR